MTVTSFVDAQKNVYEMLGWIWWFALAPDNIKRKNEKNMGI